MLREQKVLELARQVPAEFPYTAIWAHAANDLFARRVSAVTIVAPPGHWIGTGESMIAEDSATGASCNMLDKDCQAAKEATVKNCQAAPPLYVHAFPRWPPPQDHAPMAAAAGCMCLLPMADAAPLLPSPDGCRCRRFLLLKRCKTRW
jgi:hypothetical protein